MDSFSFIGMRDEPKWVVVVKLRGKGFDFNNRLRRLWRLRRGRGTGRGSICFWGLFLGGVCVCVCVLGMVCLGNEGLEVVVIFLGL